jgi:hypothetical protein
MLPAAQQRANRCSTSHLVETMAVRYGPEESKHFFLPPLWGTLFYLRITPSRLMRNIERPLFFLNFGDTGIRLLGLKKIFAYFQRSFVKIHQWGLATSIDFLFFFRFRRALYAVRDKPRILIFILFLVPFFFLLFFIPFLFFPCETKVDLSKNFTIFFITRNVIHSAC